MIELLIKTGVQQPAARPALRRSVDGRRALVVGIAAAVLGSHKRGASSGHAAALRDWR